MSEQFEDQTPAVTDHADAASQPDPAAQPDATDQTASEEQASGEQTPGEQIPDAETASEDGTEQPGSAMEAPGPAISEPGKIMRIGTMAKQLLEEVRHVELDEAGRTRLAEIHRRTVEELSGSMSADLADELNRLDLPFDEEHAPSHGELRLAQAQLVGWLEGLFHGIQTAIMAQQAMVQQQGTALPPGIMAVQQDSTEGRAQTPSKDDAHPGPGNYL